MTPRRRFQHVGEPAMLVGVLRGGKATMVP
jgi:hypothetical protein